MNRKKGNRCTAWILMIVLVSFFLSSCGEPSYCTLNNVRVAKGSSSESDKDYLTFSVTGTDEDLAKLDTGPGLLLCYVFLSSDYLTTMDTGTAISAFSRTFSSKKMYIDSDNSLLTFTLDGETKTLYAFQRDTAGSRVQSPDYSLNLKGYVSGTTISTGTLKLNKVADRQYTITDSSDNILSTLYTTSVPDDMHSIHVFGAITAEQGSFSNIYWSNLVYFGGMAVTESE